MSGTVVIQCVLYYQTFTKDKIRTKLIVAAVWLIDLLHTSMVSASCWFYLIDNFGSSEVADRIPWTIGATIALTATLTVIVHSFFAHRVYTLSGRNLFITIAIGILAACRVGFAMVTTSKLIRLRSFTAFTHTYSWVFTLGLSLAVTVDILIASSLCYFLNKSRTGFSSMDSVINSITLYTVETGLLTCIITILSLVCWITMPDNLVFLGLHFAISKMYANALLATLNARTRLRGRSHSASDPRDLVGFRFPAGRSEANRFSLWPHPRTDHKLSVSSKVHISVEKTVDIADGDSQDINLSLSSPTSSGDMCYPPSPPPPSTPPAPLSGIEHPGTPILPLVAITKQKHSDGTGHITFDSIDSVV